MPFGEKSVTYILSLSLLNSAFVYAAYLSPVTVTGSVAVLLPAVTVILPVPEI